MRVIEKKMVNAVSAQGKMSTNNTKVESDNGLTKVMLHGNTIAEIDWAGKLLYISNCGWQTTTTKSRLNAILGALKPGTSIYQKKGTWYLSDAKKTKEFERNEVLAF